MASSRLRDVGRMESMAARFERRAGYRPLWGQTQAADSAGVHHPCENRSASLKRRLGAHVAGREPWAGM